MFIFQSRNQQQKRVLNRKRKGNFDLCNTQVHIENENTPSINLHINTYGKRRHFIALYYFSNFLYFFSFWCYFVKRKSLFSHIGMYVTFTNLCMYRTIEEVCITLYHNFFCSETEIHILRVLYVSMKKFDGKTWKIYWILCSTITYGNWNGYVTVRVEMVFPTQIIRWYFNGKKLFSSKPKVTLI